MPLLPDLFQEKLIDEEVDDGRKTGQVGSK